MTHRQLEETSVAPRSLESWQKLKRLAGGATRRLAGVVSPVLGHTRPLKIEGNIGERPFGMTRLLNCGWKPQAVLGH